MKPLFVVGCPRSGTTALANYLNRHPEILLCIERYKYLDPERIQPDLFTVERILDYRKNETNIPRERHTELLGEKDPEKLRWIGDKEPVYYKYFENLSANNPGARFIMIHRPVEEVAESFEARAQNPADKWPARAGFEEGVRRWNLSIKYARDFMQSREDPNLLILDYRDFFYRNEACILLISRFLELEFDESVRESWGEMSRGFEAARRSKVPLTGEQEAFLKENRDHAAERWILDLIERQWSGPVRVLQSQWVDRQVHEERISELETRMLRERRRFRQQREKLERLVQEQRESQDSKGKASFLLDNITRLRAKLTIKWRRLR